MFTAATGDMHKGIQTKRASLDHIDSDGWQDNGHTDVIRNLMDAMSAVPGWGDK